MTLFHGYIGITGTSGKVLRMVRQEAETQAEAILLLRGQLQADQRESLLAVIEEGEEETNLVDMFIDNGYFEIRRLPDGTWAFLKRLMFTTAICVGADDIQAFVNRYCYEDSSLVLQALDSLKDLDDEPVGWIARRPEYKT